MDYEKKYKEALERAKVIYQGSYKPDTAATIAETLQNIFPEIIESEDKEIRREIIDIIKSQKEQQCHIDGTIYDKMIAWLEKQSNVDKASYEIAEKEKYDFVSGQFIECRKSFDEFKEDNSYWFEYVGNDTYIGRSDNILNKKFHITPKQLYRLFTQQHCSEENNVNEETNAPTGYGKYVDECLNEAAKHFFSEGEDKYSVADLFYAGVRCGKSWLEKQDEQKPVNMVEPKFKVGDWITDGQLTCKVLSVTSKSYELHLYNDDYCHFETDAQSVNKHFHLWTIKDAKDGDILTANIHHWEIGGDIEKLPVRVLTIFIYQEVKTDNKNIHAYVSLFDNTRLDIYRSMYYIDEFGIKDIHPATKEQRDKLEKSMHEAGYEWDSNTKELNEIETIDIPFSAKDSELIETTYFIPEGFHAEIVDNKVIIKKGKQKPTDTYCKENCKGYQETGKCYADGSCDAKIKTEQNPALSKEDNTKLRQIEYACMKFFGGDCSHINWLRKFTRPQTTWKPSKEQIVALRWVLNNIPYNKHKEEISELLDQIKDL